MKIGFKVKYKALLMLEASPKKQHEMQKLVRSRGKEFRECFFTWLDGRADQTYRMSDTSGPAAKVHTLTPFGLIELIEMKKQLS